MKRIDTLHKSEFQDDVAELTADYQKRSYYFDGKTVPTTIPKNPVAGDTWFDIDNSKMFVYIDGAWVKL